MKNPSKKLIVEFSVHEWNRIVRACNKIRCRPEELAHTATKHLAEDVIKDTEMESCIRDTIVDRFGGFC